MCLLGSSACCVFRWARVLRVLAVGGSRASLLSSPLMPAAGPGVADSFLVCHCSPGAAEMVRIEEHMDDSFSQVHY